MFKCSKKTSNMLAVAALLVAAAALCLVLVLKYKNQLSFYARSASKMLSSTPSASCATGACPTNSVGVTSITVGYESPSKSEIIVTLCSTQNVKKGDTITIDGANFTHIVNVDANAWSGDIEQVLSKPVSFQVSQIFGNSVQGFVPVAAPMKGTLQANVVGCVSVN
jgi:hypothetical protein